MVWTFEDKNLGQGGKDDVRALIGDNVVTDPQLQDEEIRFYMKQRGSIAGACAICCRALAAKFARSVDQAAGSFRTMFSQMSKAYTLKALEFEAMAANHVKPYAGGISLSDKITQDMNTDRKEPEFAIGMTDNVLPVPPVGIQTEEEIPADRGVILTDTG